MANGVVALCTPLTPLCSSALLGWVGWVATATAAIAAAASILLNQKRPSSYAVLIAITIACMLGVGLALHGLPSQHSYEQAGQLLIFGVIVSEYRKVIVDSTFILIALAIVALIVAGNFSIEAVHELFRFNRSWSSPVFDNGNVLGYAFAILTMFSFMVARSATTRLMRYVGYFLCAVLVFFVAASGSRSALLSLVVFFSVYGIATVFKRNRILLFGGAFLTLAMVPVFTLGYPTAIGVRINLLPAPAPKYSTSGTQACVPSSSVACPSVKAAPRPKLELDDRAGGILGLNKTLTSGREIIWPTVIELAGRSPVWGHGFGISASAYVPWPFTGMNAHSGFLQVYYQLGLIGLALYFILWGLLFARAITVPDVNARSASAAVLCAACVLDTLEIVLIQNHSGFGVALGILATTAFIPSTTSNQIRRAINGPSLD